MAETGPAGADYIARGRWWWEDALNPLRAAAIGPDVEAAFRGVRDWLGRKPPHEDGYAWAVLVHALATAIVSIHAEPKDVEFEAHRHLRREIETLSAEQLSRDTLKRLAHYLAEATPRGAEYMERVGYLKQEFEFLERSRSDGAKGRAKGTDGAKGGLRSIASQPWEPRASGSGVRS
jgi:hypothetical protein